MADPIELLRQFEDRTDMPGSFQRIDGRQFRLEVFRHLRGERPRIAVGSRKLNFLAADLWQTLTSINAARAGGLYDLARARRADVRREMMPQTKSGSWLVLDYSSYGHIERMAQAKAQGARSAGVEVHMKRVPELVPHKVALAANYKVE
jgi:hypothetical protein